jgi:NADPH:quinone reductase-like Zn-dependent oxidoreductase
MRAVIVTDRSRPPAPGTFDEPTVSGPDDLVVDVLAAGLHPRVRSQADGSHYTDDVDLPFVPGVDGVGREPDGTLRYFVLPDTRFGSMAERTAVDVRRSVVLDPGADVVAVAAGANPAMSAWIALRRRVEMAPGARVLVLGATGNAGRMAIQVAKHLGAGSVVAAGRNPEVLATLPSLGADEVVALGSATTDDDVGRVAGDVDIVLDYLWGDPAAHVMAALVTARADRSASLSWIQIGAVAGPTAPVPSAALRASGLAIVGSGQGSVRPRDIVAELPEIAARLSDGTLQVGARPVPLEGATEAWATPTDGRDRIVLIP